MADSLNAIGADDGLSGAAGSASPATLAAHPAGDGMAATGTCIIGVADVTESGDGMRHAGSTGPNAGPAPDDGGDGGASGMSYPDLVSIVVAYLNLALQAELGSSATFPKVFADAAIPGVRFPYIIVHDTDEHYTYQSGGSFLADGHIYCVIKANGKAQAHAIGLRMIRVMADAELGFDEGTLLELRPVSGSSTPIVEMTPGPNAPIATERTIGWHYKIIYPSN